jgi:hypothetical protein
MKALSIQQPWAWLIVNGYKDIENRTWQTRLRGTVLIHAGKTIDRAGYQHLRGQCPDIPLPPLDNLEVGGIVGQCELIACVESSTSPWFAGPYGFVLVHGTPLPFVPLQGHLGFFDVVD